MSSLEITITDELSSKLAEAAKQSGKSEKDVVVSLLERTFLQKASFNKAINAMLKGERPGEKLNIAALLQNTSPRFETVEDALQFSRKYQ